MVEQSARRPPLNALRAFEAAARLKSMTAAGRELDVTHGAISRQIMTLERYLNVILLRRLPKSVECTAEGATLAVSLTAAFNIVSTALAQVQTSPLTISCSSTIMQNWLIPRLSKLTRAHPEIEIRLNVSYKEVDMIRDGISIAIRNDMFSPPQDVIFQPLVKEEIGLVCSPEFARRYRLKKVSDLEALPILMSKTRETIWSDWLSLHKQRFTLPRPVQAFDHFYLMIQAASCGMGAAVAPKMIVADEIEAGRLVAPFGFEAGPYNMVLWLAPQVRTRPDHRLLVNWIRQEALLLLT